MSFLSFQIPPDLREQVKTLQADGVNISALLRRLLRQHIEQMQTGNASSSGDLVP